MLDLLTLPADLKPGRYQLESAVLLPVTQVPAIRLAIDVPVTNGWARVSEFEVLPPH